MLQSAAGWQVVGEAADGLEALQHAAALVPDLILLDVELPGMSGIEAAARILADAPRSKILFVSAHRSWDIAEAAFGNGARGYILKSDAGFELLPAMDAIAAGRRFISGALVGRDGDGSRTAPGGRHRRCHEVSFYSEEDALLDTFNGFAETALNAGKALIVIAVESHLADLYRRLHERLDIDQAIRERRYLAYNESDALSGCMVDGLPDEARFWKNGTSLVLQAAAASRGDRPGVAACGECSDTLLRAGRLEAAIRVEQLWDELATTFNVDTLCGYSTEAPRDEDRGALRRLCAEHSAAYSQ